MGQLKRKSELLGSQISRTTKRKGNSLPPPSIKSLPQDLLIEVLTKVATSSFSDLHNVKLATKDFLEASNDGWIFRHVSLESFPKVPWKNTSKFRQFMENCYKNGNPEAIYRKGMLEFFNHRREASGLANLKASAQKGHAEACYVYGIILYSSNLKEEGVKFLNTCEAKLGFNMVECRQKVKEFFKGIWIINKISLLENDYDYCLIKNSCKINERRNYGWDWIDENDCYAEHTCEACKWSGEVSRFCNMLWTGSYN